ncbi:hypothetical protein I4U23_013085 [Adineta vaga]|nr:hypothetical protein I4U23_013085 [Adineta vaga]
MGSILSTCKRKKRPKLITIIHDKSTQTTDSLSSCIYDSFHHHCSHTRRHSSPYATKTRKHVTIRTDPLRTRSRTNVNHNTTSEDRTRSTKIQSHQVQRSTSLPIDTFVIDISNRQVRVGQPISINIRYLPLNTSTDAHSTASMKNPTYVSKTILDLIPNICEKYPNLTIDDPNQSTRKTLHTNFQT